MVLKKVHDPTKLGIRTDGTFKVQQVHINDTLNMQLCTGVIEHIIIWRVLPYQENKD